jgi:hypothetical protein
MFDNQNYNSTTENDQVSVSTVNVTEANNSTPPFQEGLFQAENLAELCLKKQKIEMEIQRCKKLIAESTTNIKEVFELKDGGSVRVSQSKLGFSLEHKKTDFENISKSNIFDLTRAGVLTPVQRIGLNEETLKSLSEEKIAELLDQKILKQRDIFIGHTDKLPKINSELKDQLAKDGVIKLPVPQVRVYAKSN